MGSSLWYVGLVAPWHGILFPQPGIEPKSPALKGGFLITGTPEKPQKSPVNTNSFYDKLQVDIAMVFMMKKTSVLQNLKNPKA